jgi:hypothetical protein
MQPMVELGHVLAMGHRRRVSGLFAQYCDRDPCCQYGDTDNVEKLKLRVQYCNEYPSFRCSPRHLDQGNFRWKIFRYIALTLPSIRTQDREVLQLHLSHDCSFPINGTQPDNCF